MTALLITAVYTLGWLAFTVPAARFAAGSRHLSCQRGFTNSYCARRCPKDCRERDGDVTMGVVGQASVLGVVWPILVFPALAYYLATRKPTPAGMARRIAELEREVGIS